MSPALPRRLSGSRRDNDIDLQADELGRDLGQALDASFPQRYSIATLRPSIQPSSRSRCTKAPTRWLSSEGVVGPKNPMVGRFACWRARNERPRRGGHQLRC